MRNVATVSDHALDTTPPTGTMTVNAGAVLNEQSRHLGRLHHDRRRRAAVSADGERRLWPLDRLCGTSRRAAACRSGRPALRRRPLSRCRGPRVRALRLDHPRHGLGGHFRVGRPCDPGRTERLVVTTPTVTLSSSDQDASMRYKWAVGTPGRPTPRRSSPRRALARSTTARRTSRATPSRRARSRSRSTPRGPRAPAHQRWCSEARYHGGDRDLVPSGEAPGRHALQRRRRHDVGHMDPVRCIVRAAGFPAVTARRR